MVPGQALRQAEMKPENMRKKITLYIQGVNYLSSPKPLLQRLLNLGYRFINAKPNYKVARPDWLTKENTHSEEVIAVEWKADLNPASKASAIKELKKTISFYSAEHTIILVGTSLGGLIATKALAGFSGKEVSNLILVGAINTRRKLSLEGIRVLNIYSKEDLLARLATRISAPMHGSQELEGENILNIEISKARHDELFGDLRIPAGIYKR